MADSGSGPTGGGASGAQADGPDIPPAVLRSWDQAEARLFPLVMAQPDLYQQAISMVGQLAGRLRETCPDLATLIAEHQRGGDLLSGDLARGDQASDDQASDDQASDDQASDDQASDGLASGQAGIRPDLVAAAACAMRYRELVASRAAQGRLAALARAREQGLTWAVVEEIGSADRAPYIPYQRVEADVSSGRAVVVSIEPDETLSRAVHRLDECQIDLVTGALRIGEPVGSYLGPDEFAAALRRARDGLAGTAPPA